MPSTGILKMGQRVAVPASHGSVIAALAKLVSAAGHVTAAQAGPQPSSHAAHYTLLSLTVQERLQRPACHASVGIGGENGKLLWCLSDCLVQARETRHTRRQLRSQNSLLQELRRDLPLVHRCLQGPALKATTVNSWSPRVGVGLQSSGGGGEGREETGKPGSASSEQAHKSGECHGMTHVLFHAGPGLSSVRAHSGIPTRCVNKPQAYLRFAG